MIEEGGPQEAHVESAGADWDEICCDESEWLRAICVFYRSACWVVFCSGCGKVIKKRWNILP